MPEVFGRVISWIGSFESIQRKEDKNTVDGGQDQPTKVRREPNRNIRIWLQDESNDSENEQNGSWPLENLRMANALKMKDTISTSALERERTMQLMERLNFWTK